MFLSTIPYLLNFRFFAPLLLRVVIGGLFVFYGYQKLTTKRTPKRLFFESVGFRQGLFLAIALGIIELVGGLLLVLGLLTQPTALILAVIMAVAFIVKFKHPTTLEHERALYFVLLIILISLTLSGPGYYAFDLPL